MLRTINKFLLTLLVLLAALPALSDESLFLDKGFRLPLELIEKHFTLMKLTPTLAHIKAHIIKTNYKISSTEAELIAKDITEVSACLSIDPWILTSLIQKESSFVKTAVSPTGAVGLTQFTSIGIKEVNDQLGMRGRVGAPESVTLYFAGKIRECVDPSWVDLWNRVNVPEESPDFYGRLKEEMKRDGKSSIVYGGILLKIYLAFINHRNTLEVAPLKTSEIYFQALQLYNGEEGESKLNYARAIFKNLKTLYPNEVNFPY